MYLNLGKIRMHEFRKQKFRNADIRLSWKLVYIYCAIVCKFLYIGSETSWMFSVK